MASAPASGPLSTQVSAVVVEFAAQHYPDSGAEQFEIDQAGLAEILCGAVGQWDCTAEKSGVRGFLTLLRLDELVLARACMGSVPQSLSGNAVRIGLQDCQRGERSPGPGRFALRRTLRGER